MAGMGRGSALLFAIAVAALVFARAASAQDPAPWRQPVAGTVEQSRDVTDPAANDFIRLIFVPPGASVTSLGLNRMRVFMAPASFLRVAGTESRKLLSVGAVVNFTGGAYSPTNDLAAMRCHLPDPAAAAFVATWPNVIAAINVDLGGQCNPMPPNPTAANQVFCLAQAFEDTPDPIAVKPIANAAATGLAMMQVSDTTSHTGADVLGSTYGIGLGFSGLGFSVAGSLNNSLSAAQSLQQSVMTEYLVANATLKAAGCRCIQVPTYAGRDSGPLDPDYITRKGKLGADGKCVKIGRLGVGATIGGSP
jgi:hypothetical protein